MFGRNTRRETFEREVRIEMEILTKLHGEEAAQVAGQKAARPSIRSKRRKVLEETARRLNGQGPSPRKGLLGRLFGQA